VRLLLALTGLMTMPQSKVFSQRLAVIPLLIFFFTLSILSVREKSETFDEASHLTGGYNIWKNHDYRINADNGLIPKLWGSLPLAVQDFQFVNRQEAKWRQSKQFGICYDFLYRCWQRS
jgi:hypothetical protein